MQRYSSPVMPSRALSALIFEALGSNYRNNGGINFSRSIIVYFPFGAAISLCCGISMFTAFFSAAAVICQGNAADEMLESKRRIINTLTGSQHSNSVYSRKQQVIYHLLWNEVTRDRIWLICTMQSAESEKSNRTMAFCASLLSPQLDYVLLLDLSPVLICLSLHYLTNVWCLHLVNQTLLKFAIVNVQIEIRT